MALDAQGRPIPVFTPPQRPPEKPAPPDTEGRKLADWMQGIEKELELLKARVLALEKPHVQ